MKQLLELYDKLLTEGNKKGDRTGTGTSSIFGYQMRFDLSAGFPLVTTKKVHLKSIIYELIWFLRGDINIKYLNDNGVHIWDEWADENGDLGPVYGKQWRNWWGDSLEVAMNHMEGCFSVRRDRIDQIASVIQAIRENPDDRGHIVSAWNVADIPKMRLRPCHLMYQFYVLNGRLSCAFVMRSSDAFLGLPFNLASYALLTHMIAQQCNLEVGDLVYTGHDVHLYENHIAQAQLQITREPRPLPTLKILRKPDSIFDYKYEDFELVGYDPHPAIKAEVSV